MIVTIATVFLPVCSPIWTLTLLLLPGTKPSESMMLLLVHSELKDLWFSSMMAVSAAVAFHPMVWPTCLARPTTIFLSLVKGLFYFITADFYENNLLRDVHRHVDSMMT